MPLPFPVVVAHTLNTDTLLALGGGLWACYLWRLLAAIRRADPVVAGVRLTHSLPLGVKRDTSQP